MRNLSIVVPCYNEQDVLPETCRRLVELLAKLEGAGKVSAASRIYFVDDDSRDRTWALIESQVEQGLPVVGLKLSRNRGHQNALLAGLFAADGEAIVSVDADLQDDLGAIEKMLDHYEAGCDVVYGVRRRRDSDSPFKRTTAEAFYRLMHWFGAETVFNHADYRLLSRRAVEALKEYREVNLFLRGLVPLIGFRSTIVEYDRLARFAGESKYPLRRMISLSLNAITSFSITPLRIISATGLIVSSASALLGLWVLGVALFTDRTVAGWASTVLPIYFLGGIQLLSLGVIGEYIGKIYMEAKGRPRFIVEAIVAPKSEIAPQASKTTSEGAKATSATFDR
jgi:glycosyltransferase involved in cell wall biosynthesis